jgi:putative hydrolase of the HAD superfamily
MNPTLLAHVRRLSHPLAPVSTGRAPRLLRLPDIRCVLFDVYGTLLVSGSGDVGTTAATQPANALQTALAAGGIEWDADTMPGPERITQLIQQQHATAHRMGLTFPEIDIRHIWETWLQEAGTPAASPEQVERIAITYEMRVNPVWPMPGMEETLTGLHQRRIRLGIISNAQFYTPYLFPVLTGRTVEEWGFDPGICVWSYRCGEAKPAQTLFLKALNTLGESGLTPDQILYVGNDMRNDVWPAHERGCRTALFAGDDRSLRLRTDDTRVSHIIPDVELAALPQLLHCL